MATTTTTDTIREALDPEAVVRTMFEAAEAGDLAGFTRCWAEDAVWQNMPIGRVRGRDAIVRWWRPLIEKPGSFRAEIVHVASAHGTVFTERLDHLVVRGLKLKAPVSGVFEVKGGLITFNREYWDFMSTVRSSLTGSKILNRTRSATYAQASATA